MPPEMIREFLNHVPDLAYTPETESLPEVKDKAVRGHTTLFNELSIKKAFGEMSDVDMAAIGMIALHNLQKQIKQVNHILKNGRRKPSNKPCGCPEYEMSL